MIGAGSIRRQIGPRAGDNWTKNTKDENEPPNVDAIDRKESAIVEHSVGQLVAKVWTTIIGQTTTKLKQDVFGHDPRQSRVYNKLIEIDLSLNAAVIQLGRDNIASFHQMAKRIFDLRH